MISYQGLFDIMKEKNIKQIELREKGNKDIMKMLESLVTVYIYILERFCNLYNIFISKLRNLNNSQAVTTII